MAEGTCFVVVIESVLNIQIKKQSTSRQDD
jgi:hypothetical protein